MRAALRGLEEAQLLQEFHTTIASYPGTVFGKLAKVPGLSEFDRRSYPDSLASKTFTDPTKELGRIAATKLGWRSQTVREEGMFSVDAIYHRQDERVAEALRKRTPAGVYTYEDGALATFRSARELGVTRLYELPTVYYRSSKQLLAQAAEQYPEWASTMRAVTDSPPKLRRKDEEIALAEHIFVASTFVAETLELYPGKLPEIHIIPYGFPPPVTNRQYEKAGDRKLKLLFVGGLSQRKGLAEMFNVVEHFKDHVSLTVVGRRNGSDNQALDQALPKHNYIPTLPHHKVLELMRQHDVLLFPALCEGFGLVITEAMSQGTPVITNNRTAGRDLITNKKNGLIVEASSEDSLSAGIQWFLDHPGAVADMGRAASNKALERPWTRYEREFAAKVAAVVTKNKTE